MEIIGHTGSWGTPELFGGLTEKVGDFFGLGRTSEGGSTLKGVQDTQLYPVYTPQGQTTGQFAPLPTRSYNPYISGSGGSVQGAATTQQSTSGGQAAAPSSGGAQMPQGPSEQDLINEIFNPTFNYLNQAEQTLRGQQPGIEQELINQYGTSKQALEGERAGGMAQLGQSEQSTFNRKEDAASAARRLYDELVRGGRQRFGGASSAGQAYSELTGAEQQRRMGGIQQQFGEAMNKIELAKNDLNTRFTTALTQLEDQKNSAINDARRYFQDKLMEISRMRGEAESNKAQMRLQELQNLRNAVYQINLQDYQYKQQLAANRMANEQQVDQARQQLLSSAGLGSAAYQQFLGNSTTNPTTGLTMGYTPTAQNLAMTGQVSRRPEDQVIAGITTPRREDLLA